MAVSSTSFGRGNRAAIGHGPRKKPTPKMIDAKLVEDLRVAARELTPNALRTLEAINDDETAPPAARISAAKEILDRGWGKPKESLDVSRKMTLEDLVMASFRQRGGEKALPPPLEPGELDALRERDGETMIDPLD